MWRICGEEKRAVREVWGEKVFERDGTGVETEPAKQVMACASWNESYRSCTTTLPVVVKRVGLSDCVVELFLIRSRLCRGRVDRRQLGGLALQ